MTLSEWPKRIQRNLSDIDVAGSYQPRAVAVEAHAEEYAARMAEGDVFPPIKITTNAKGSWLVDGFTRFRAYQLIGPPNREIICDAWPGGPREAMLMALAANATNAHAWTLADRRKSVAAMLADPVWGNPNKCEACGCEVEHGTHRGRAAGECPKCKKPLWTTLRIATACRVSESVVRAVRDELSLRTPTEASPRRASVARGRDPSSRDPLGRIESHLEIALKIGRQLGPEAEDFELLLQLSRRVLYGEPTPPLKKIVELAKTFLQEAA